MNYEVEKNMVCSTCHVTKSDMEKLESDKNIITVNTKFWIQLNLDIDIEEFSSGYSNSFCNLFKFAKSKGFDNLKLDCDGPVMIGFATHDW